MNIIPCSPILPGTQLHTWMFQDSVFRILNFTFKNSVSPSRLLKNYHTSLEKATIPWETTHNPIQYILRVTYFGIS